jgi:hypothetical protein
MVVCWNFGRSHMLTMMELDPYYFEPFLGV